MIILNFYFKTNCLFCGDICDEKVSKHPERWKRVIKCTKKGFNESILKACYEIQDSQSNEIIVRIEGAVSDLSAAGAMYHQKCYLSFMFKSNKPNKNTSERNASSTESMQTAFRNTVKFMEEDENKLWSSVDLFSEYVSFGGQLQIRQFMTNILEHFGDSLLILSGNGLQMLLHSKIRLTSLSNMKVQVLLMIH